MDKKTKIEINNNLKNIAVKNGYKDWRSYVMDLKKNVILQVENLGKIRR